MWGLGIKLLDPEPFGKMDQKFHYIPEAATIASSEACMLGGLAHKWNRQAPKKGICCR
jgi:glutamate/tyrosine decarboxylase-like PLP-dependent enzyme